MNYSGISFNLARKRILPTQYRYSRRYSIALWTEIEKRIPIQRPEDWYSVQPALIQKLLGISSSELLHPHQSIAAAVISTHPDHPWKPWRFSSQSSDIWTQQAQREFFEYAAKELGVNSLDGWQSMPNVRDRLFQLGGEYLIHSLYDGSVWKALSSVFPEHQFLRWKFGSVGTSFWKEPGNLRSLFDYVGKELKIKTLDDWYRVPKREFVRVGGATVLVNHFGGSLIQALQIAYPEHDWLPWKRSTVPRSFWTKRENLVQFIEWLGKEIGVQKLDDWYQVTKSQVSRKWPRLKPGRQGAATETGRRFNISLAEILMMLYPEHKWTPWKFVSGVPMKYWDSLENQRRFFDWYMSDVLGHVPPHNLDVWYSVPYKHVAESGGLGLLSHKYGASLPKALRAVYREHTWLEWKFSAGVSKSYWEEIDNRRLFFDELFKQLNLSSMEDWYSISPDQIKRFSGTGLLKFCGHSASKALITTYNDHKWELWKFNSPTASPPESNSSKPT